MIPGYLGEVRGSVWQDFGKANPLRQSERALVLAFGRPQLGRGPVAASAVGRLWDVRGSGRRLD